MTNEQQKRLDELFQTAVNNYLNQTNFDADEWFEDEEDATEYAVLKELDENN